MPLSFFMGQGVAVDDDTGLAGHLRDAIVGNSLSAALNPNPILPFLILTSLCNLM